MNQYVVGISADLAAPDGLTVFGDIGLDRLTDAGLRWEVFPDGGAPHAPTPEMLAPYDAVLSLGHWPFSRDLVAAAPRLKHVARFGAGYDGIDVAGLAEEGVIVTNTPLAARRPLATAALTFLLALSHRLVENHRLAAGGDWERRGQRRGIGVAGRTVGIVGLGGVGSEVARLIAPLGVRIVSEDRPSARARAAELGVELVSRTRLAAESDFVVLTAALTPSSRHLVDAGFLAAMRPTAYVINVGRGQLIDQAALTEALRAGRIAGAALDVLDPEPPAPDEPLLRMDNVIVTPHSLCWTADFVRDGSGSVVEALVDVARGRRPVHTLDASVYEGGYRARPRA
ncbi:2-hydroxyacid dehydrogenase [Georgenia sp. SYP-B2076]|uniref:2-hydroxyacid dehydrogenase n=1 Tax=Georgenia sp. SYP-B2076 TaxID=2495881 RepID=UPI000F8E5636|nr:NAD(P)-dependent oxidoreductase [Georgenia sp. SYP-B2076]